MADLRIPIELRIGVTGHRRPVDEKIVRGGIQAVLARLDRILAHTPHAFVIVSPLAEGADRLVAGLVLSTPGSALEVVLPLPEPDYLQDFATSESRAEYQALAARARALHDPGAALPRPAAYGQAGRRVVRTCDVLIAVWDGRPAAGEGGTGEIAAFAARTGRTTFCIHPETGRLTEERGADRALEGLACLDGYNAEPVDAAEVDAAVAVHLQQLARAAADAGLPPDRLNSLAGSPLPAQFVIADLAAGRYQQRHKWAGNAVYGLAAISVAIVAVQTLFLPHLPQLLWLEVLSMAAILLLLAAARRGDWHRKWIDYRFLAERLRSGVYLHIAGFDFRPVPSAASASEPGPQPGDWLTAGFNRIWRGRLEPPKPVPLANARRFLQDVWIRDQMRWFERKGQQHRRRHERLALAGEGLFGLTLAAAAIHSAGLAHALATPLTFLAIVLPATGGALASIRIHREYLRNAERYAHMARALSMIEEKIEETSDPAVLKALLEEVHGLLFQENQDWRIVHSRQKLHAP